MVDPEPLLAPAMLPVIVPIVHVKVQGVLDDKLILGPVPLHVLAVFAFVTTGVGLTVTVMAEEEPTHDPVVEVGITLY